MLACLSLKKIIYRNNNSYFNIILLLSGDISLNPGPTTLKNYSWDIFKKRGLHIIHLNINSLLPKIDEIRHIAKSSNLSVIGLSETKLDDSVFDAEINIEGYTLIRSDRNRHGGGVACYVKQHLTFDVKYYFSNEIENIFIDIFLPKTKPFTLSFFYRPPNQYNFLHLIEDDFKKLNPESKELHILGDININTLIDDNRSIFEIRKNTPLRNSLPSVFKQYIEFCSSFSLKQLISSPTRITCSSSTIIDHILTNTTNIISQSGVIDLGISDHNIIFLIRKMKKIKLYHHTYIKYRSFKNYAVSEHEERLKLVNFPNYLKFDNIDSAYSNFLKTLTTVIDSLAHSMAKRIKVRTQEWFDGEISELIAIRNQQYKKFKKTLVHVDKEIFKKTKYKVIKMIKSKKNYILKENFMKTLLSLKSYGRLLNP